MKQLFNLSLTRFDFGLEVTENINCGLPLKECLDHLMFMLSEVNPDLDPIYVYDSPYRAFLSYTDVSGVRKMIRYDVVPL